jgi:hypothetical protein
VRQLHGVLQPLASVPDDLQVVFISLTADEDVREAAAKCKALHVRGKEVAKWARYLSAVSIWVGKERTCLTDY